MNESQMHSPQSEGSGDQVSQGNKRCSSRSTSPPQGLLCGWAEVCGAWAIVLLLVPVGLLSARGRG